MTEHDQIKALAELDGWKNIQPRSYAPELLFGTPPWMDKATTNCPNYLASYDAIIPLIQKQSKKVRDKVRYNLSHGCSDLDEHFDKMLTCTASQLCEALLRSTGKWVE